MVLEEIEFIENESMNGIGGISIESCVNITFNNVIVLNNTGHNHAGGMAVFGSKDIYINSTSILKNNNKGE